MTGSDAPHEGADALSLSESDNVATALRPIALGEEIQVGCGRRIQRVTASQQIPFCHKISLAPLPKGSVVVKYGGEIGVMTEDAPAGSHIHVHNMRSNRARTR